MPASALNPLKHQRWKESDDGLSAKLSKRWTRALLFAIAGLWNLGGPTLMSSIGFARELPPMFFAVGLLAGVAFLAYALRELLFRVSYAFRAGEFRVTSGPLSFRSALTIPLSEIEGFTIVTHSPEPFELRVRMRSGATHTVPAPLDGVIWRLNGKIPISGVAPVESFSFVTEWLNAALDKARHEGGQYRVAPGMDEVVAGALESEEEDYASKSSSLSTSSARGREK
jgi:hypothetical protein